MTNKYDKGLEELLKKLKKHPEIVKELIFEPNNCESLLRVLKSREARRMLSRPVAKFLKYVSDSQDGYPIAQCFGNTQYLCAKGTLVGLCGGGTRPPCKGTLPCGGGTRPPPCVKTRICVQATKHTG